MPTPILTPGKQRHDDDDRFNIDDGEVNRRIAEMEKDFPPDKTDDSQQKNDDIKKIQEEESSGNVPDGSWENNTQERGGQLKRVWWKRKGVLIGGGGGGGIIVAIIIGGGMMPAFMLPSIMHNMVNKNDVRSGMLERRLHRILNYKVSGSQVCSDVALIKCKRGHMPKEMLNEMEKNGIKPVADAKGTPFESDGNGDKKYVKTNPHGYDIPDGNGGRKIISAADFSKEIGKNPALSKAFRSAFNVRFLSYNGKFMAEKFFKKLGVKRNGGMASDKELSTKNVDEKFSKKFATPKIDGKKGIVSKITDRFTNLFKKTGKKISKGDGDPILLVGIVGCVAVELPMFITGTFRAIQAVQLIGLLSDLVLSPAGMQQAGKISPEALSAVGKKLTEQDANGKSALDSKYLQSAIGVNTKPTGVSKFTPGFALMSNPAMRGINGFANNDVTKDTCKMILSPMAPYVVTGIETAVGLATAGVGEVAAVLLKALGKVAALVAVPLLIEALVSSGFIGAIANMVSGPLLAAIGNYVGDVKGEALGDALGTAAETYFPQAALAGGGAVLKTDQVVAFNRVMEDVNNQQKTEDIATLSPFDTSSPYTFLGNIVSNLSLYSVAGNPLQSSLSMAGHLLSSPFSILSSTALAEDGDNADCGYAAQFDISEDIAINSAGYPCVGIPAQYIDMSPDDVLNLVSDQIDPETGEPKDGSDIDTMLSDCSDGDLESIEGCSIESMPATSSPGKKFCSSGDDDTCLTINPTSAGGVDAEKRAAESLYVMDMQVENMLNGSDSEVSSASPDDLSYLNNYLDNSDNLESSSPNLAGIASSLSYTASMLKNAFTNLGTIVGTTMKKLWTAQDSSTIATVVKPYLVVNINPGYLLTSGK